MRDDENNLIYDRFAKSRREKNEKKEVKPEEKKEVAAKPQTEQKEPKQTLVTE